MTRETSPASRPVVIIGLERRFKAEHRIRNQIRAFSDRYPVNGYGEEGVESLARFERVAAPPRFLYRAVKLLGVLLPEARIAFESFWYRGLARRLRQDDPRLIIVHNIPDALAASSSGRPFVFDSNEYLPRQFDGTWVWRHMEMAYRKKALSKLFLRASVITVEGAAVAEKYVEDFPATKGKYFVAANMPAYSAVKGLPRVPGTLIRMIHHGMLVPERGLEKLLRIAEALGKGYELTLMGGGPSAYIQVLKDHAARLGNVRIQDPVPYEQIVPTLYGHDFSLVIFGSPHFHHKYMTVPNKFWESIQARVPVVVSPESAMARTVRELECGIVPETDTVEAYVAAIRNVSEEVLARMKAVLEAKAYELSLDAWIGNYAETLLNSAPETAPRA